MCFLYTPATLFVHFQNSQQDFLIFFSFLTFSSRNSQSLVTGFFFCTPVTYYASKCVVETHLIFPKEFLEKDVSFFCCLAWQNLRNL